MARFISAFDEYVGRMKIIEQSGFSLPKDWAAVYQRLLDYQALTTPAKDRLVAAVSDPTSDADVVGLRADAYAEAAENIKVNTAVIAGVHAKLRDIYSRHAARIYSEVAEKFNKTAEKFAGVCSVVDVEADSRPLLSAPAEQRAAYTQAPLLATELSALLPAVQAAAYFCGAEVFGKQNEPTLLALAVDAKAAHRRRLWTAWETTGGNTGRWAPIIKCGAAICAAANPATLRPYRIPAPMVEKVEERNGIIYHIKTDPEDDVSSVSKAAG